MKVFARLSEYGMIISTAKANFLVREGVFLGFVISEKGIQADPAKLQAVQSSSMPTTTTEIRAFVNAAGYFRHLINRYAEVSGPLTDLTGGGKNTLVTLSTVAKSAWLKIKDAITSLPIVNVFDWRKPVILVTYASQFFVGACLLQSYLHYDKSFLHPVAYFSKKSTQTQSRYSAQERELLGIVHSSNIGVIG